MRRVRLRHRPPASCVLSDRSPRVRLGMSPLRPVAAAAGTISATVAVTAAQADPDHRNNSDGETTTVTATGRDILVTNTNASGPGSLLQAITDSNRDTTDVDRICSIFPAPVHSRSRRPESSPSRHR